MSSPFKTPQEFLEVKGPLYTFANSSVWLTLFLVFSVVIFLWFIYASYTIKSSSDSKKSDSAMMSVLILTGFVSLAQSAYISSSTAIEAYLRHRSSLSASRKARNPVRISRTSAARQDYLSRSPRKRSSDRS